MSENREIQCEYSTTRSNENKCKALEIEFHNCLNILEQKKCPIYKLKQQLQAKEQECKKLKDKNQYMKDYIKTVETSRNELGQECAELKEELKMNQNFVCDGSIESTALCKILEKYKQALDEIEETTGGTYYETEQTAKFKMQDIQDIINRTKEQE